MSWNSPSRAGLPAASRVSGVRLHRCSQARPGRFGGHWPCRVMLLAAGGAGLLAGNEFAGCAGGSLMHADGLKSKTIDGSGIEHNRAYWSSKR